MYDATGVRLHAGRQAEVSLPLVLFFSNNMSFSLSSLVSNYINVWNKK